MGFRRLPLLLIPLLLGAQAPPKEVAIRSHPYTPPAAVLRAETTLVEAELTVRDSRGNTIAGLMASDFEVFDNGARQTIAAFSELHRDEGAGASSLAKSSESLPAAQIPAAVPKYVIFFFDDLHMANSAMLTARRATHNFIASGLKPSDFMSIVTTSGQGDLDFTNDPNEFADKVERLASHTRTPIVGGCGAVGQEESYIIAQNLDFATKEKAIEAAQMCACGGDEKPSACRAKATAAVDLAANMSWEQTQYQSVETIAALGFAAKKLSEVNGTRILVLTSSGFLIRPNQPEIEKFIDGAVRWNIVVHALDAKGLNPIRGGEPRIEGLIQSNGWAPLYKVTEGTGGHFFKNSNDLAGAMNLAANPQVTYLIAFNPSSLDGRFHTLKIRFKTKHPESVQFRPGYFSRSGQKSETSNRAALDDAVFSKRTLTDFPAAVAVSPSSGGVSITVTVDVGALEFVTAAGLHGQQLVFLMTLLDNNGGFVNGKEAIMDLALSDARLEYLKKAGLKAVATLTAPAGVYQVRTIVREGMKGNLAASTLPVELK